MSVYVQYDPFARMGNRMFQLAAGYIISKARGEELYHDSLPNFNIENNFIVSSGDGYSIRAPHPTKPLFTRNYGDQFCDLEKLSNYEGDVIINSFAQKSKLYIDHQQDLREFFSIEDKPIINKGKLVIHIRLGDYKTLKVDLPYEFYQKLIDRYGYTENIIVTDSSDDPLINRLREDGHTIASDNPCQSFKVVSDEIAMRDFYTLLYSDNVVIAQSTFSWWAGFLGNHSKIIFPFTRSGGAWSLDPVEDDPDLFFERESITEKFIYE